MRRREQASRQRGSRPIRLRRIASALLIASAGCAPLFRRGLALPAGASALRVERTDDPAYLRSVDPAVSIVPLLTVGESVARTSQPQHLYRMVGVPDGLGAARSRDGTVAVWMNHELDSDAVTHPIVDGEPVHGAFVSEWRIDPERLTIRSGDLAYSSIRVAGSKAAAQGKLAHLCSGFLAGPEVGFDRPMFLAGEEASGASTFDHHGGSAVAIAGDVAYVLPGFGHFRKENLIVLPGTGELTVAIGLNDQPGAEASYLYLFIGHKHPHAADALARNGLLDVQAYVLTAPFTSRRRESRFSKSDGAWPVEWHPLDRMEQMTDQQLRAASRLAGGLRFARIEDGAADPQRPGVVYFVSTGESFGNWRGRVYQLMVNPRTPLASGALQLLLDGDAGDPIISPDNIDVDRNGVLLIQEDPTGGFRGHMGREASIWAYRPADARLIRVAEIDQGAVPSRLRGARGQWESSGAIDVSEFFGPGSWLVDVQAHSVNSAGASSLQHLDGDARVDEGGQLLLLRAPVFGAAAGSQ